MQLLFIDGMLHLLSISVVVFLLRHMHRIKRDSAEIRMMLREQMQTTNEYAWHVESRRYELTEVLDKMKIDYASSVATNRELDSQIATTKALLNAKDEVIGDYHFINAHQLRAPVARILGLTQLLTLRKQKDTEAEIINLLQREAQALDEVVHDIQQVLYRADNLKM